MNGLASEMRIISWIPGVSYTSPPTAINVLNCWMLSAYASFSGLADVFSIPIVKN